MKKHKSYHKSRQDNSANLKEIVICLGTREVVVL